MENWTYAGFWWRFLAYGIDFIVLCILGFMLTQVVLFASYYPPFAVLISKLLYYFPFEIRKMLFVWLSLSLLHWLYVTGLQSSPWHATAGQKLCKMVITDPDGKGISFLKASARHFATIITNFTCGIGYVMAAFTERHQTLHDDMAGTVVLRKVD